MEITGRGWCVAEGRNVPLCLSTDAVSTNTFVRLINNKTLYNVCQAFVQYLFDTGSVFLIHLFDFLGLCKIFNG